MENNLNFTKKMKQMMSDWKGKILKGYIENSDDGCLSIVRFLIGENVFDLNNAYVSYEYPDKDRVELSCFSCVEVDKTKTLQTHVVDGKCKENIIGENIIGIYIVKDIEKGKLFDSGIPYELEFETALILQTEKYYYVFWRDLIFYMIEVATCCNMEEALKTIKSVAEIQTEAQEENPYAVTVERFVESL